MIVINDDWITSIVASGTTSGYPASNMQDKYPKKQWKYSPTTTATLTVTPSDSSSVSTLSMFNVECASATVTENGRSPVAATILTTPYSGLKSIYYEFNYVSAGTFVVTITKDATSGVAACGILLLGPRQEVKNPMASSMTEGYVDYSIIKELSNGATYVKKRDLAKTFSGVIQIERTDSEYYELMNDTFRSFGPNPTAWLVTDQANTHWHVFARTQSPVITNHSYLDHSLITFELIEVL